MNVKNTTICGNVYDADGWNIFVCSDKKGHNGLHGEAVMSDMSDSGESYVLAQWPDLPEMSETVPAWAENDSGDLLVAPVPFDPSFTG